MKLLDIILGRNEGINWKKIPEHNPCDAVLILSKSMLSEADALIDDVSSYPSDSKVNKDSLEYANTVRTTLIQVLNTCAPLLDTPLGDHTMVDALEKARAEAYESIQAPIDKGAHYKK